MGKCLSCEWFFLKRADLVIEGLSAGRILGKFLDKFKDKKRKAGFARLYNLFRLYFTIICLILNFQRY